MHPRHGSGRRGTYAFIWNVYNRFFLPFSKIHLARLNVTVVTHERQMFLPPVKKICLWFWFDIGSARPVANVSPHACVNHVRFQFVCRPLHGYRAGTWPDGGGGSAAAATPGARRRHGGLLEAAPKTEYVTGTGPCGAPLAPYHHQPLIEHHHENHHHVQHHQQHQLVAAANGQLRGQSGGGGGGGAAMAVAAAVTATAAPVQPVNPLSTVYATKRRRRNGKR